jgi:hypothetical protein
MDDSGVAFSVNFYSFQTTHLTSFHQPLPVGTPGGPLSLPATSVDSSRADALPSTLCLFLDVGQPREAAASGHRKGRRKLAGCIVTPERAHTSVTAQGYAGDSLGMHATQAVTIDESWNRVYVGPTYGVYLTDSLAVGASVWGVGTIASSTWSIGTLVQDASPGGHAFASAYDTAASAYSADLLASVGLLWHVGEHQLLGVSASTPSVHLLGHYQGTSDVTSVAQGGGSSVLSTSDGNYEAPPPVRLSAGFGADMGRMHVEGDLTGYLPVANLANAGVNTTETRLAGGATTTSSVGRSLSVTGQPAVDAAVGVEWFLSPGFSLLAGASTDFSALSPLAQSPAVGTLAESRMQRAAMSFGIGSYGDGSELLLGTQLAYGWGKSIAVDPYGAQPQLALVEQRSFGAMLVIAGGVSLTAFKRTLQDLRTMVRLPVPPKK